ncbi:hypothetical protein [Streptomyces sp. NPDC053541]|uniref:hypothetical protein n=1 Tax=Streptomyces sp. NPDC053541 TaxID=3365709 RepID=UPI0037D49F0C
MTATARRFPAVSAAGIAAAAHHIATGTAALTLTAGWFVASLAAEHVGQGIAAGTVGLVLGAESIRADRLGRTFPHCPLCTPARPRPRRAARKETAK